MNVFVNAISVALLVALTVKKDIPVDVNVKAVNDDFKQLFFHQMYKPVFSLIFY